MGKKIRMKSKGYIRNPYSRYSMDTVKLLVYVFVMLAIPAFGVGQSSTSCQALSWLSKNSKQSLIDVT